MPSIDSNKTWKKRKDTVSSLASGTLKKQDEEEPEENTEADADDAADENEEIGE